MSDLLLYVSTGAVPVVMLLGYLGRVYKRRHPNAISTSEWVERMKYADARHIADMRRNNPDYVPAKPRLTQQGDLYGRTNWELRHNLETNKRKQPFYLGAPPNILEIDGYTNKAGQEGTTWDQQERRRHNG